MTTSKTNPAPHITQPSPATALTLWCFCCALLLRSVPSPEKAAQRGVCGCDEAWRLKPTGTSRRIRGGKKMSPWKFSWCMGRMSRDEWLTLFPKLCSSAAASSLCSSIFMHLTPGLIYWRVWQSRQTLHQTRRHLVREYKCLHGLREARYIRKTDDWCAFELQNIPTLIWKIYMDWVR